MASTNTFRMRTRGDGSGVRLAAEARLAELREKLREALAQKKVRIAEFVEACKADRRAVREQVGEMRARSLRNLRDQIQAARGAAKLTRLTRLGRDPPGRRGSRRTKRAPQRPSRDSTKRSSRGWNAKSGHAGSRFVSRTSGHSPRGRCDRRCSESSRPSSSGRDAASHGRQANPVRKRFCASPSGIRRKPTPCSNRTRTARSKKRSALSSTQSARCAPPAATSARERVVPRTRKRDRRSREERAAEQAVAPMPGEPRIGPAHTPPAGSPPATTPLPPAATPPTAEAAAPQHRRRRRRRNQSQTRAREAEASDRRRPQRSPQCPGAETYRGAEAGRSDRNRPSRRE